MDYRKDREDIISLVQQVVMYSGTCNSNEIYFISFSCLLGHFDPFSHRNFGPNPEVEF